MDSALETPVPLFTTDELARLRRRLLNKGRELAEDLALLMAGQKPKATDLLDAKPGETKIEKLRRYLDLVDRKIKAVAAGTYGRCAECGTPFSILELEQIPWLDRCRRCS